MPSTYKNITLVFSFYLNIPRYGQFHIWLTDEIILADKMTPFVECTKSRITNSQRTSPYLSIRSSVSLYSAFHKDHPIKDIRKFLFALPTRSNDNIHKWNVAKYNKSCEKKRRKKTIPFIRCTKVRYTQYIESICIWSVHWCGSPISKPYTHTITSS